MPSDFHRSPISEITLRRVSCYQNPYWQSEASEWTDFLTLYRSSLIIDVTIGDMEQ
jgi:hypothetical protein